MASDITLPSVNGWYAVLDDSGKVCPVMRRCVRHEDDFPWLIPGAEPDRSHWISDVSMTQLLRTLRNPHLYRLLLGEEVC